jgi:tRNA (guanosine-2'-O-)-methyltransferase
MTPERLAKIKDSLNHRQPDLTVVMENVRKPHNLAAVARALEAVGGLQIHAISSLSSIRLSQMAAGGIRKWISVRKYASIEQGLQQLKQRGHRIIATTLSETSKDYRDIDYTVPSAILVGEELDGISTRAIELADETITIPIVGMVQSLNVSVASALVLYEAYRQREQAGMYNQCALDAATYSRLLFEACHPEVARYCRQQSLDYPAINDDAELLEPVADSKTFSENSFSDWIRKMKN